MLSDECLIDMLCGTFIECSYNYVMNHPYRTEETTNLLKTMKRKYDASRKRIGPEYTTSSILTPYIESHRDTVLKLCVMAHDQWPIYSNLHDYIESIEAEEMPDYQKQYSKKWQAEIYANDYSEGAKLRRIYTAQKIYKLREEFGLKNPSVTWYPAHAPPGPRVYPA